VAAPARADLRDPLCRRLIEARKLNEPGAPKIELNEIAPGNRLQLGPFNIEYIPVSHSIPESNALAIRTPAGLVVHTGDWKIDPTPYLGGTTRRVPSGASARRACSRSFATRRTSSGRGQPERVGRRGRPERADQQRAAPGRDHHLRVERRAIRAGGRGRHNPAAARWWWSAAPWTG
jgi:hypothetical protein